MDGPVATLVKFGEELTDLDSRFSLSTSKLDFTAQSVCYFSLSAGAANNTNVRFYLDLTQSGSTRELVSAERLSSRHNNLDIVTADNMETMPPNSAVTPRRESILSRQLTSLTAFCPSDIMHSPTLEFKRSSTTNRIAQGYLVWDEDNSNSFITEISDLYFFTFTAKADSGRSFVNIELNLCNQTFSIQRRHFMYDGVDTFTTSALVECDYSKKHAFVKPIQPIDLQSASLFGFPYRPAHNVRVYWHLMRRSPTRRANLPYFSFDDMAVVLSRAHIVFDSSGVTVQQSGYYYIHLSAVVDPKKATDFHVVKYDPTTFVETILFRVTRLSEVHDGSDFISRSAIVQLTRDNSVRVRNNLAGPASAIGTRMSGMLLYKTE